MHPLHKLWMWLCFIWNQHTSGLPQIRIFNEMQTTGNFLPSMKHRNAVKFAFLLLWVERQLPRCCFAQKIHDLHTDCYTDWLTHRQTDRQNNYPLATCARRVKTTHGVEVPLVVYGCMHNSELTAEIMAITRDYWRLLETTGDYWRLLEISRDYK